MSGISVSAQSLEDAANIATEFIYSLDNIPNEIRHLLEEIKHKESRVQELQYQIDSDSARWIKHTLRSANHNGSGPSTPSSSPTKPVGHLPAKIKQSYAEIEQLSTDKLALAERVVELLTRTSTRLAVDLNRARVLQGEPPTEVIPGSVLLASASASLSSLSSAAAATAGAAASAGSGVGAGTGHGSAGSGLVASTIGDSLKQALNASFSASDSSTRLASLNTPSSAPPTKKRKVTATSTPSIKVPASRSISPVAPTTKAVSHTRSRLSRQSYTAHVNQNKVSEPEPEEEEEEEPDPEDEDGDDKLYCFCQKPSAGDMIACDNNACPYEWFHLECVGITEPPPASTKWYCPFCINRVTARKGRKKS
ncbi:hypothetical protein GYMLUDRAFT_211735 [Collybiopsis luxurians FD-317 M1]|nr:hypothetical protein GYMLUDRAFT_211735 [Collybiopsis luxurians FD-317 M1]